MTILTAHRHELDIVECPAPMCRERGARVKIRSHAANSEDTIHEAFDGSSLNVAPELHSQ